MIRHLPIFDSHKEKAIIGFAYDFTPNEEEQRMFAKGYLFSDIEDLSEIPIDTDTKFPVSIRFFDKNTSASGQQEIADLVHLAFDPHVKEVDRCSSAGGLACYMKVASPVSDFMADDEKKKKKEDKSEDEESDDEKDEKKDKKKEKKETSDFTPESISKADYDAVVAKNKTLSESLIGIQSDMKELSDFAASVKQERVAARNKKMEETKADLGKDGQTFTINSDFLKEISDFDQIDMLSKAFVVVEAPQSEKDIDPYSILGIDDFGEKAHSLEDKIKGAQKNLFGFE